MAYRITTDERNQTTGDWERKGTRTYTQKVAPDQFTMLLHPIHPLLQRITHIKDFHVLLGLCELAEFNSNRVFLIGTRRAELMTLTKMTSQHLSNSLTRLRKMEIISGGKGEALINPNVLWKGQSAARINAIEKAKPPKPACPLVASFEFDAP